MKTILRLFYKLIPFKKHFFLILKKIWQPSENTYRHFHFKSPFTVQVEDNKTFKIHNGTRIENEIFWEGLTGNWEKESMQLWIKLSENSKYIFDIGANNGVYALVAKTMNPKSQVFAFEPHPIFFDTLKKNISINNFEIETHKKAVSDVDGIIKIEDYTGSTDSINVESITLDTFIKSKNLDNVDLFKIDVETFEPQVITGLIKSITSYKPTLLIEILNEEVATSINDLLKDLGYLFFNIDERGGIRQTEQAEKSDFYNYLICQENIAKKMNLI